MVRINLLPPEITEKRRFERRFGYIVLVALVVFAFVGFAFFIGLFLATSASSDLQSKKDTLAQTQQQAEAFKVFEDKQTELESRKQVAAQAVAGRIDWARLSYEISLVLPSDLWVERLQADEMTGLQMTGWALDPNDTPDTGHKSIAATLVRLADLEQLYNVWLSNSQKSQFGSTGDDAITYQITSSVRKPGSSTTTATGVPAPPASPAN